MSEWFPASICVFFLWGFWGLLPKFSTRFMEPRSILVYEVLGATIVGLILLGSMHFRLEFNWKGASLGLLTGVLGFLGGLAYLFAATKGPIIIVSVLSALYPALVLFVGFFLLGEEVTKTQAVGLGLAVISMFLLAK